ncbi:MAG: DUF4159 domain-containing protein [Pseudomonadota bacterium]
MSLFGIAFSAPWLLLGLIVLPVLWILLRVVPPAPIKRRFPGVALLLGLADEDTQSDKTPWWLLLLRMLAVAAVILGFAGPVLNPQDRTPGSGPLLVLADASWASAPDWQQRVVRIETLLSEASRDGRETALVLRAAPPAEVTFQSAEATLRSLPGQVPSAWEPQSADWLEQMPDRFDTYWISDGLSDAHEASLLDALQSRGSLRVFENGREKLGLTPARYEDGEVRVTALRSIAGATRPIAVLAQGLDPAGNAVQIARQPVEFLSGESTVEATFELPAELRNRITRLEIEGLRSAGAVTLADDSLRRREVALLTSSSGREGLELLSPAHYLSRALKPTADLIDGPLPDMLLANPDVVILADVAQVSAGEQDLLVDWIEEGGLLVRFAGPRLAASDVGREREDPLLPVRLRIGGRTVGGAMSWGEPKSLAPFAESSPFFGLSIPEDVRVNAQVLAQPDPTLSERTIANLTDGTPLVTAKPIGQGQVILFHVTANAEWSSLPLSGLFVEMLERLAISTRAAAPDRADLEGTTWVPEVLLSAFGRPRDAGTLPGVAGERFVDEAPGPNLQPGLYSGGDRRMALNVLGPDAELQAASWPSDVAVDGLQALQETPLKGWLLTLALGLLMADIFASLFLSGRLTGARNLARVGAVVIASLALVPQAEAQEILRDDDQAVLATSETVLAYVITGNARLDEITEAGLRGISQTLFQRTSIEPAQPIGVNLETDELAFFPFLYWSVTPEQAMPSNAAYAKLNAFLRSGGMIMFDTRDADTTQFGASSPNGTKLRQLAAPLDIPPIEPIPSDHVLTRSFYLLQDFPGRFTSRDVWVEAAPADAVQAEGMPFRNLNDGVTPVIIGGNDWVGAWATERNGSPMLPLGRGFSGERQREVARRFGVNVMMHVLTGNYKSDQVHVPALLDRLGQ